MIQLVIFLFFMTSLSEIGFSGSCTSSFLHLTDLHLEQSPENLESLKEKLRGSDPFDFVLIGGDNGGEQGLKDTLNVISEHSPEAKIAWIKGNHDLWNRSYSEIWEGSSYGDNVFYLENESLETEALIIVGTYGHYDYRGGDPTISDSVYQAYRYKNYVWNDRFIKKDGVLDTEIARKLAESFAIRYQHAVDTGKPIFLLTHTYPYAPDLPYRCFASAYAVNTEIGLCINRASRKPVLAFVGHTHQKSVWSPNGYPIVNPGSDYQQVRYSKVTVGENLSFKIESVD